MIEESKNPLFSNRQYFSKMCCLNLKSYYFIYCFFVAICILKNYAFSIIIFTYKQINLYRK